MKSVQSIDLSSSTDESDSGSLSAKKVRHFQQDKTLAAEALASVRRSQRSDAADDVPIRKQLGTSFEECLVIE